ncbi:MAG: HEAT repeat domain-containing protein [Cytophagales bacterium]
METKLLNELVEKYNKGIATASEIGQIENLIETGALELTALKGLQTLDEHIYLLENNSPSLEQDHRFYKMLGEENLFEKSKKALPSTWLSWKLFVPRFAFGAVLLFVSGMVGYYLNFTKRNSEVKQLTQQVTALREMMMISLLEKESAIERLKAVSITQEITDPSLQVTQALMKTLNADPNVNVRLAALEALQDFAAQPHVREGLIRSIALQDSPLVQVALAELMLALQEKSSVSELKKVLQQNRTPKEVKDKIKKTIDVLI